MRMPVLAAPCRTEVGRRPGAPAAAQGTDKNRPNPTSPSGANASAAVTELARHQLKNHFDKFKTFIK